MPQRWFGHRRDGGGQISKCGQANILGEHRTGNGAVSSGIEITVSVYAGRSGKGITKGVVGLRRSDQWTGRQIEGIAGADGNANHQLGVGSDRVSGLSGPGKPEAKGAGGVSVIATSRVVHILSLRHGAANGGQSAQPCPGVGTGVEADSNRDRVAARGEAPQFEIECGDRITRSPGRAIRAIARTDGEVEGFGATRGINVYDVIIGTGIAADNGGSATIKERCLSCCLAI